MTHNNEAQAVKASDLRVGDTIRIEYGRENNFVTCTVISICETLFLGKYMTIYAEARSCGRAMEVEITPAPSELIEKVA